jgi:hypothetical protein
MRLRAWRTKALIMEFRKPQFGLLLSLLAVGSMWLYVHRVLIPYQKVDAQAKQQPRGNLSDLYPRWLGARELLLHHRDPYSPEITREIQIGFYGRPLDPSRAEDPKDQEGFAYPVYVVFVLAPTITMQFSTLQAICRWLLPMMIGGSVLLWLRLLRWRLSLWGYATVLVLTFSSFAVVQGLKLQQLSLVVSALIAAQVVLLAGGQLVVAGILLSIATLKPQLVVPLSCWLLLWSLSRWKERRSFFWAFLLSQSLLLAGAELVLPGWIGEFLQAVAAYRRYTGAVSPLETLTTHTLGILLSVFLAGATAVVCWKWRLRDANTLDFALVTSLVLAVTVAIVPMVTTYNQVLLLPAILVLARSARRLWTQSQASKVVSAVVLVFLVWPWILAFVLLLASYILPPSTVARAWAVPLWTIPATPLAIVSLSFVSSWLSARPAQSAALLPCPQNTQ